MRLDRDVTDIAEQIQEAINKTDRESYEAGYNDAIQDVLSIAEVSKNPELYDKVSRYKGQ